MKSYQAIACAFVVCMAIGGTSGDYHNNYGGSISKIVVYGTDKVVLPTMKNMLIAYCELLYQSSKYTPKVIKSEIDDLIIKINSFKGYNNKKIIAQAETILYKIQKGYISDCDYAKQLEECMHIIILLMKHCSEDYTYHKY